MGEIYVSTDIEADGPIPGPYSMLSFASAAFLADKTIVSTFTANLTELPEASQDPGTMAWWRARPVEYQTARENPEDPALAMTRYVQWLEALAAKPVFVGYPAAYDFMFIYWYLMRFVGRSPFSHSAFDIKTAAAVHLGLDFRSVSKRTMPASWFGQAKHTHVALSDALEQGVLFCNLLRETR